MWRPALRSAVLANNHATRAGDEALIAEIRRRPETLLLVSRWPARRCFFQSEFSMKMLMIVALFSAFTFSPASAAMMACTVDNMAKSAAMMAPGQSDANKEMAMANTDMSNGKMKSACMHDMKAQKMSMMK